ncbi:MAG: hypothetical protein ACHQ0I_02905 [Candidatus Lutacidiplasmatales archaeon]
MRAPPNVAVRRFATVRTVGLGIKLAALAVFLVVLMKIFGGF